MIDALDVINLTNPQHMCLDALILEQEDIWRKEPNAAFKWMISNDLSRERATAITSNLNKWVKMKAPIQTNPCNDIISCAICRQNRIRWR